VAPFSTTRRRVAVTAVAAAAAIGVFVGLGPTPGGASSHREAPLIAADPQADNTDLYAFVSPDAPKTVTIVSNFIPFEEPAGGPNFYQFGTGVRYDVRIDNNADAHADLVYRWTFTNHTRNPDTFLYNTGPVTSLDDPDLNMYQTYDVQRIDLGSHNKTTIVHDATAVPSDVGEASMPDYDDLRKDGIVSTGASKYFAGQADDPFFADLRVFDLLYGGDLSETGDDTLKGFNVNALALQVPKGRLAKHGIPGAILTKFLSARRQEIARTGDYTVLVLFSVGTTQGKWGTLLETLLAFKRLYDRKASLEEALPELVHAHPARYGGMTLPDLCEEMHQVMTDSDLQNMANQAGEVLSEQVLTPAECARHRSSAVSASFCKTLPGEVASTWAKAIKARFSPA